MERSPHFPVGTFDIPVTPPSARYRSRESGPRSPSVVVDSTYSRRSSLPTFSSGSSERDSYFAHHTIEYNSINGPPTGSSGFSFTPSLLWRSDSIVSRNTIRTTRSTTSSSSNASSARSKHSSMWGTSDTGSRRSGLRSFLSLDSAPRSSSDTSDRPGPVSIPDQSTGIITFAQAGEAFNNSHQRGRAMSVDNAHSVAWIPSPSHIDTSFTSRDYCLTTDVRILQDIPEASTVLLFDSESFNDESSRGETLLSNSSRNQPSAVPADSPENTLTTTSPILPSPATIRAHSRSPSVATYTTTTTVHSVIKRARRGEALARLEGKFYETPAMEDTIESFMGFDDDDSSEDGDKTDDDGSGHLDILSIGLDLQSLPLPKKRESFLVAPHSTSLAPTSSSPPAQSLAISSSPGSGGVSLQDSPPLPKVPLPAQPGKARTREKSKDIRVQIKPLRMAVLSSQPSPSTPLSSGSGTPTPTSATTISSRNASPSSLSSFTPFFDEAPRPRPGKRHNRDKAKKDKGFSHAMGSLESLFSIGIQTGNGESPKLNRFEFETWLDLDGDDSGVDGTSKKSLL